MADAILPQDVIDGASVPDRPNLFVLGCFDRRITFYSQQVRALALVHALKEQGYLQANPRIAVVGAGAAGLTAAAAAALVTSGEVVLFESSAEVLPIQSATDRRRLDPHIYDWPEVDATDPVANLPILDWEAGSCRMVRDDVRLEFDDIAARTGARFQRRMRCRVTGLSRSAGRYDLSFVWLDDPAAGEPTEGFDMVFIAVGFGLEALEAVQGIQAASYWSDAGVPVAEFAARASPRFLVSGNGDGALIDLVAAGAADFEHTAMIEMISRRPGIDQIYQALIAIDQEARAEAAQGRRFDFVAAYDAQILALLQGMGLIAAVGQRLRPGVRLTLQTQHAEMFEIATSALNRLAAYLTMKACEAELQAAFEHIQSDNIGRNELWNGASVQRKGRARGRGQERLAAPDRPQRRATCCQRL